MERRISISTLIEVTAATGKTCWNIGSILTEIARDPADGDDSLKKFSDEVHGLKNTLDAVYASVGKIAKLPSWTEAESDKEVWTAVHISVCGCSQYLRNLVPVLRDIQNSDDKSASLAMRAQRLRINKEDFDYNRIRVHRYTKKLQLALTMINLHICTDIASRSESKMDNVYFLMNKLQVTVEGQWSAVDSNEEEAKEALQLRRAAQKALTRASILSDIKATPYDESVRSQSALSQDQEPLDGEETINIETWIDHLVKSEEDAVTNSNGQQHSASSYSTEVDQSGSHKIAVQTESEDEFNPEEDFDMDLMLALSKAGKKHYRNSNPEQAAENLDLALQYAKKLSPARYVKQDLTEDRLILASIYLQKRELDKAEEQLSTIIRESVATEANKELITDAHLKLARVYFMKKAFEDALQNCQKCLHARAKVHGRDSQPYYEAIQLLVLIYSGKGSHLEADVMLEKLPPDLREETELQVQTSAPVGSLPTSPPRSPVPTPSQSRNRQRSIFYRKRNSSDKGRSSPFNQNASTFEQPESTSSGDRDLGISGLSVSSHIPRQPSTSSSNIEPGEMLANNGFTGDFDSAKALLWAVADGHLRVVHYLLEGYTVPKSRKTKFSLSGGLMASDVFIKHARVDGNPKSKSSSPLITSIEYSRVMVAKLLLDKGASLSLKDPTRNMSPLRMAAEKGEFEILKLLLGKGAWIESPSTRDLEAFQGRDKDSKEYRAYGPIHGAAEHGHEHIVSALLSAGAAMDARDSKGNTPLKHACQRGQAGVARMLIRKGASVMTSDDSGYTPLHAASYNGNDALIRLLKAVPDVVIDARNNGGQSPLSLAAEQGHVGAAKLLLSMGAKLEHRDDAGWTPLISASNRGQLGCVLLLLGAGAEINAKSDLGSTPLDRAEYRLDERLAATLRDNGGIKGTAKMERVAATAFQGYTL